MKHCILKLSASSLCFLLAGLFVACLDVPITQCQGVGGTPVPLPNGGMAYTAWGCQGDCEWVEFDDANCVEMTIPLAPGVNQKYCACEAVVGGGTYYSAHRCQAIKQVMAGQTNVFCKAIQPCLRYPSGEGPPEKGACTDIGFWIALYCRCVFEGPGLPE